ncbi:sigma-54-dependent Fis family transcriptional regulator [Polymorphobacter sp. PAMC 29334]|uniref:sigma-54 interaction domain-containing protein n=1 Tax=Polymorphobacter sp. PAMC 29334 TaxID=2862331 RepID=UPI001D013BFE|nr:sigma-54 dependent transcriptional regulator [Polymorphobacter sp. PAMC 29334]
MSTAAITVSDAAAAMYPLLAQAIYDAGGRSLRHRAFNVVAYGEPCDGTGAVMVARSKCPRLSHGSRFIEFADADLKFAAATIVALAQGAQAALADPASIALEALAARVAARGITVLIEGATGTGKEVLARSIHAASPRCNAAFVAVNCAALPEAMLEALLFGHERGAFTGAGTSAKGLFRAADGGTLLLDEIAELPLGLQAKLLRALQESEVLPIGATAPVKVDVRIIAAANRDLAGEVAAGRFRADLYYRIAVFPLATMPLASRRADIVPIAAALWLRQGTTAWPTAAALARLEGHDWPGNVRELGNVLARAAVIADSERIEARDIVFDTPAVQPVAASLGGAIREREFDVISATLADCAGRRGETATRLGISERTLRYKLAAMSAGRLPAMSSGRVAAMARMTMQ